MRYTPVPIRYKPSINKVVSVDQLVDGNTPQRTAHQAEQYHMLLLRRVTNKS